MKLTKLALACALTSALAACGGGGSDAVAPTTRTLDGFAAKGLIKNGIVKVFLYNADGTKPLTPIVTTRTKADGSYSVGLGSNIGLFTVEVSADADTKMADEVSHQDIAMPTTMTLRSVIKLDSAASTAVKGYVTPLTEMLVKAAESAGGLTSDNFESARAGVKKMMGFDPLETKPINVEDSAAATAMDASQQKQSLYLAALSKLANDSSNTLGCTGNISEKIDCVVKATSGSAALKDGILSLSTAAGQELRTALNAVINDSSVNKTAIATADGQADFSPVTVPVATAVLEPIPAAKAMFASLRTNYSALSNAQKTGELNIRSDAMKKDFDTAIAPLDQDLADWIRLSHRGVAFFESYKAGSVLSPSFAYGYGGYYGANYIGGCTVYSDTGILASTVATNKDEAASIFCSINAKYVPNSYHYIDSNTYSIQRFKKTIQLVPVAGQSGNYTYQSRTRIENVTYRLSNSAWIPDPLTEDDKVTIGSYGTPDNRAIGTLSYTKDVNQLTSVKIKGDMPARTDDFGVALTDKESWNVDFSRVAEASDVYKYNLSGDITAIKGGVAVGSVALQSGSYVRALETTNGTIVKHGVKEVNLALAVAGANSQVVGTLSLSNFSDDKNGTHYIPTDLKFVGSLTNAGSEFFNGTWTAKALNYADYAKSLPDSSTNFVKKSASFVGIFRIPARPDLKLSLSASNPAFEKVDFNGQYDDGTNTILISSSNASPRVINISSANGVSMQLNENVNTADVIKNSSKIATLNRATGIIDYIDGSFQSLK